MNTTDRIRNVLRASHAARNSDFELWLIYAAKSGLDLSENQIEVLRNMPTFETIRRTRQKLQENGEYPADPEVEQARFDKFKKVRQNIPFMGLEDSMDDLPLSEIRRREYGQ